MATYREQYERVRRWYLRFKDIDKGRPHDTDSENYVDEIYAFFLNCYHLKDWIRHDPAVPEQVRNKVESHINANTSLRLCADICNSLKHLRLDRTPRSVENPTFGKKCFAVGLGPGLPTTIALKYVIDTNSGPLDAFTLATECVTDWDRFLSANGL
jgi:hypothetical protein